MSLLMDALRKAEDAKRQAAAGASQAEQAVELTLEPLPPSDAGQPTRLPDLAEHSAALDAGLSAVAREARASTGKPPPKSRAAADASDEAARVAARNVFAAKTNAPARGKAWPIIGVLGVLGVAAALGIGAYFVWQLQALSGSAQPPFPPPSRPAPVPAPAPVASMSSPGPAPVTAPIREPTAAPVAPSPVAASTPSPAMATPHTEKPRAILRPTNAEAAAALSPTAVAARQRAGRIDSPLPTDGEDLRVRRTHQNTHRVAEDAFDALQAGRLDDAQRAYEQLLRSDAQSTDALLGLATIAVRRGRHDQAQAYYLRALEADPSNAIAQAGLINGRGYSDAAVAESRLKGALDAQPDSSALLFALGNLYARQARWSEAQQAYFRAYAAEPDNADILFNLAVALDHLRQAKLAAQYYQMALDSARASGDGALFDRDQARARLRELKP